MEGIIITKTPLRISFMGGGTDLPEYFNKYGGIVIGAAINKYMYVTINSLERIFEKKIRLSYSKLEQVDNVSQLKHELARSILTNHPFTQKNIFLDMHSYADLPSSSGIGSSSSFAVGMLNALYLLHGVYKSSFDLAAEAIKIEREILRHKGGWQDQILAAYGGFNKIIFAHGSFEVEPICISQEKLKALQDSCLLFFTGQTRFSSDVQTKLSHNSPHRNYSNLHKIASHATEAVNILTNATSPTHLIQGLGELMAESWKIKKSLADAISNHEIDTMYQKAMRAGALGGKVCGAGGGGFLLIITLPKNRQKIISTLKKYKCVQFLFDFRGSLPIYCWKY